MPFSSSPRCEFVLVVDDGSEFGHFADRDVSSAQNRSADFLIAPGEAGVAREVAFDAHEIGRVRILNVFTPAAVQIDRGPSLAGDDQLVHRDVVAHLLEEIPDDLGRQSAEQQLAIQVAALFRRAAKDPRELVPRAAVCSPWAGAPAPETGSRSPRIVRETADPVRRG